MAAIHLSMKTFHKTGVFAIHNHNLLTQFLAYAILQIDLDDSVHDCCQVFDGPLPLREEYGIWSFI